MSIIGVDIDGILADFNTSYIEKVKEVVGKDLFPADYTHESITTWNYPAQFGYTKEELDRVWKDIKESPNFWFRLEPYADARRIYDIDDIANPLYFITSRMGWNVKLQTECWLKEIGVPGATVLISSEKGECCHALNINYYIDDRVENCQDVRRDSPSTKCFILSRPWNTQVEIPGVTRINTLEEFINAAS